MKTKARPSLFLLCLLTVQSQSILNNSSFPSGRFLILVSLGFAGPELGPAGGYQAVQILFKPNSE